MISSLCFLPRGAAKETPDQQELSAEEINDLVRKQAGMTMDQIDDADNEQAAKAAAKANGGEGEEGDSDADMNNDEDEKKQNDAPMDDKEAQLLKELGMDGYDEEPEGAELMLGGHKLMVHESNADDPYVTVPDYDDHDSEDEEDLLVKKTDVVLCVGKTEEEASSIEVYLYEEEGGNLYVHHDFPIPSFPLALCWMDVDPRLSAEAAAAGTAAAPTSSSTFTDPSTASKGSFLAIGTFQTGIEIWNLDVLDVLEPVAILGGRDEPDPEVVKAMAAKVASKKGKKGKKAAMQEVAASKELLGALRPGSHADAVMALAWHPAARTRLASGSADHAIKLWDVCTQKCVTTFSTLHTNKVQSLAWNYQEPNILLSGAYDQKACVLDTRIDPSSAEGVRRYAFGADIEQTRWSPHNPYVFAVALENGHVVFHDLRSGNPAQPMFTLAAHAQACTNITFNSVVPTCFATTSLDKTVKIWDYAPTPSLVTTKEVKACGALFAAAFDTNYAHLMAFGGDKGKLGVWDLREDAKCRAKYGEECDGQVRATAPAAAQANPFAIPASGSLNMQSADAAAAASASSSSASTQPKKDKKKKSLR